jgi:hypothetical protein
MNIEIGGTRVCLPAITPAVRGWGCTVFERSGYRGATDPPDEIGVNQSGMVLGKVCFFNLEIALMPIGIFPKDLARAGETAYGSITCKRCKITHRVFFMIGL